MTTPKSRGKPSQYLLVSLCLINILHQFAMDAHYITTSDTCKLAL